MGQLPSGTITFLFTDIEGSTQLWEKYPEEMKSALAEHYSILKNAVETNKGVIVKTTGDGIHAVFSTAFDAIEAALAGQHALRNTLVFSNHFTGVGNSKISIKVRMGIHTGEAELRDNDYYGQSPNRAARIMGVAYGEQILLSAVTAELVREHLPESASLINLGAYRLKGLTAPEEIYQLDHPELTTYFPPLKSLEAYKHNLPIQLTSFIGRQREMNQIKSLFAQTRLLTLLGPGGTGKTRLALHTAADLIDQFPDGVWLVELAPLTDPNLIPERVAGALNVQEQPGRNMRDTLVEYLRRKKLLLILDNVEHLVRKSAEFAENLLMICPELKILVTGREALFIGGETTLQVPSLSLPKNGSLTPERVASSEAVQLFVARAQAVRPDFALTPDNAPSIAKVVSHLDGIPLALELAAARMRMMSVEQIAERLDDRFRLLTGGSRTARPRQQTLQALIDWSWNLLDEREQVLFRRLSVFSGGWTLEAAQEIASDDQLDEFDILDLLDQLVNKSLVTAKHLSQGVVRYNMLESIRQYAHERLLEAGEQERLYSCHAEYYTAFGERVSRELQGRDMLVWLERLLPEADNAKAARQWMLDTRLDLALRMAGASMLITRYWFYSSEDIHWLEQVVDRVQALPEAETDLENRRELAKAIIALGSTTILSGDFKKGRQVLEKGIDLAEDVNVVEPRIFGLNMLLITLFQLRELSSGVGVAEASIALSQQHGFTFWRLMALGYLVSILVMQGEHEKADAYAEEAVQLAAEIDNPWMNALTFLQKSRLESLRKNWDQAGQYAAKAADLFETIRDFGLAQTARSEVGHIKRKQGDLIGAMDIYRKTIVIYQERGHAPAVAHQLECMGIISLKLNQNTRAARLLGAAQAIRAAIQINRLPGEQIEFDQLLGQLAEAMGKAERDKSMADGAKMSLDDAVTFALKETA